MSFISFCRFKFPPSMTFFSLKKFVQLCACIFCTFWWTDTDSLSFSSFRKLKYLLPLKDVFSGYRIVAWQLFFFFFQRFKNIIHCLPGCTVSGKVIGIILIFIPLSIISPLPNYCGCLQDCLLVIVFIQFEYDLPRCWGFCWFIGLFCIFFLFDIFWTSWIPFWYISLISENFLKLFLQMFPLPCSLCFLSGNPIMHMSYHLMLPYRSLMLYSVFIFHSLSSLCLDCVFCIDLFLWSLTFLGCITCTMKPNNDIFCRLCF